MTVVSNTSPISYLVLIGREEVIHELYGEVVIPEAVRRELVHPRGPEEVRERISNLPSWMKVETVSSDGGEPRPEEGNQEDLLALDPGEREVILLAVEKEAGLLLIDERAGRVTARAHGAVVTGTIGVLGAAAQKGLINPVRAVRDLRETTFRASADLYHWLLDKGQ